MKNYIAMFLFFFLLGKSEITSLHKTQCEKRKGYKIITLQLNSKLMENLRSSNHCTGGNAAFGHGRSSSNAAAIGGVAVARAVVGAAVEAGVKEEHINRLGDAQNYDEGLHHPQPPSPPPSHVYLLARQSAILFRFRLNITSHIYFPFTLGMS